GDRTKSGPVRKGQRSDFVLYIPDIIIRNDRQSMIQQGEIQTKIERSRSLPKKIQRWQSGITIPGLTIVYAQRAIGSEDRIVVVIVIYIAYGFQVSVYPITDPGFDRTNYLAQPGIVEKIFFVNIPSE